MNKMSDKTADEINLTMPASINKCNAKGACSDGLTKIVLVDRGRYVVELTPTSAEKGQPMIAAHATNMTAKVHCFLIQKVNDMDNEIIANELGKKSVEYD